MVDMSFRLYFLGLLCLLSLHLFAQRTEKVTSEYVYHVPDNLSLEEAKQTALERAKVEAIAELFGTVVSQNNFTSISNRNGKSNTDFFSLGGSEVKGEWIETIGEPKYFKTFDEQGSLVIRVSVSGRIREIVSAKIDFKVKILCNGTDLKYERNDFRNGDDLYLYFQSPIDGYLAIYLVDDSQKVYCLLPYRNQDDGIYHVKATVPYFLFSKDKAVDGMQMLTDEYVMTCLREREFNRIYVLFSPNPFSKALDQERQHERLLPRELEYKDFQRWLTDCRKHNKEMCMEVKDLVISY